MGSTAQPKRTSQHVRCDAKATGFGSVPPDNTIYDLPSGVENGSKLEEQLLGETLQQFFPVTLVI